MPIPSTPPETPRSGGGLRRGDKILIGCAVGCGALVILVGLAFFGGVYWLVSPGDQIATERILGDGSAGYLRLPDPGDDPGLAEFLAAFVLEADRADGGDGEEELPGVLGKVQEMNRRNSAQGMRMWLPTDATVSFESLDPPAPGAPAQAGSAPGTEWVAAVNLRSFPRAVRSLIGGTADRGETYRGHTVHDMGEGETFTAFYGTTLLISSSKDLLEATIARLDDGPRREPEPRLNSLPLEDSWDAYGTLQGSQAPARALLTFLDERLPSPQAAPPGGAPSLDEVPDLEEPRDFEGAPSFAEAPDPDAVSALHFGLDVVSADTLRADLTLDCTTEEAAARWARRLTAEGPLYLSTPKLGDLGIPTTLTAHAEGTRTQAALELTGLQAWLAHTLQEPSPEPPPDPEEPPTPLEGPDP